MPITKRRGRLRVILPDGSIIQESTSADTFTKAIDIAVSKRNINAVLNTDIVWCKFPLISMDKNIYTIEKYIKTLKKCECGLYVNTCSNNEDKRKLLLRISAILKLNWDEGVSKVTGTPSVLLYMQQSPDFPKPGLCHVQDFLYLWTKV